MAYINYLGTQYHILCTLNDASESDSKYLNHRTAYKSESLWDPTLGATITFEDKQYVVVKHMYYETWGRTNVECVIWVVPIAKWVPADPTFSVPNYLGKYQYTSFDGKRSWMGVHTTDVKPEWMDNVMNHHFGHTKEKQAATPKPTETPTSDVEKTVTPKQRLIAAVYDVADINDKSGIPQSNYIIEESGEYAQAIMKIARGKDVPQHAIEEAMDIVAAVLVMLARENIPFQKLEEHIILKCERAVERYRKDKET